jgi:hypothetical protein
LYYLPNVIRVIYLSRVRWAGHVERIEQKRNAYRILMENPEGKIPLARP